MSSTIKKIVVALGVVVIVLLVAWLVWYFFFSSNTGAPSTQTGTAFGTPGAGEATGNLGVNIPANQGGGTPGGAPSQNAKQKIFKIADGPVVGATFVQTQNPITTVARYVMADNGHVFDLPVDTPGAVARAVSGTTIPGLESAQWGAAGSVALLQYLDGQVVKPIALSLPSASSTSAAVHIQFLPDNITSLALSPNGTHVVYLLATPTGTNGFVANQDGSNQKNLFSFSLGQLLVAWPSQNVLLVQTKSAAGVPGIIFSVDSKTGATAPLVYAPGITALANTTFSKVLYQTTPAGAATRSTYSHDTLTGKDAALSFQPIPETCP